MMEPAKEEKPNFLVGGEGEDGFEEIEEKDEFPLQNGILVKQPSDAALLDKRRRLR